MIVFVFGALSALLLMVSAVVLVNHGQETKLFLWLALLLGSCGTGLLMFCGAGLLMHGVFA